MFVLKTDVKFFVKVILGNPKLENLLRSFLNHIRVKWAKLLRESIKKI